MLAQVPAGDSLQSLVKAARLAFNIGPINIRTVINFLKRVYTTASGSIEKKSLFYSISEFSFEELLSSTISLFSIRGSSLS